MKINNFEGSFGGFYYDQQLDNPLMRVTLHPNTKYTGIGPEYWDHADNLEEGTDTWRYSKDPIATAVLNEDFSVDIANTWSDFGGDPISTMFNEQKTMAPYLKDIAQALHTISEKTMAADTKEGGGNKLYEAIAKVTDFVADNQEKQAVYLNRALVVKGTRFSYYGGTGLNFNNLVMKFTLFPKIEGGQFITIKEQLKTIMPYIIGDYIDVTELGDSDVGKFAKEFASWQLPPAGFASDIKDVDVVQQGTMKLRFGAYYALDNLVIGGCTFNFSKTMVKDPTVGASVYVTGQKISPMYCDVTLQFKPATKYSRNKLEEFINANAPATKKIIDDTNREMAKNLSLVRSDNKSKLSSYNVPAASHGEQFTDDDVQNAVFEDNSKKFLNEMNEKGGLFGNTTDAGSALDTTLKIKLK
jgi:hypothetical protein